MGYSVDNRPLEEIAECMPLEDSRTASEFNELYGIKNKKFIGTAKDFCYDEPLDYFLVKDKSVLAKKGTRPNTNLRGETTTPNQYYLTKFVDGEVWLLDTKLLYTDTQTARTGIKIGSIEEDLQYVFLGLFGAGGGGSGGNSWVGVQGRGGASGGTVFCVVKLCHDVVADVCDVNQLPLQCGAGGVGCKGNNSAQAGKFTGLYISEDICLCASAGGGAKEESCGTASPSKANGLDFVTVLALHSGANGGRYDYVGDSVPLTTTTQYAPQGENGSITFGGFTNFSNGQASAGGNGPLGKGGNSRGGNGDWGDDADLTGGGAGGNFTPFGTSKGGNGGSGCIKIYY